MSVRGVAVDTFHLPKSGVVLKSEVSGIVQTYLSQHCYVIVARTINEHAAGKRGCYQNLTVIKVGPGMPGSTPVLANRLKIIVGVIDKLHHSSQCVRNRLQMATTGVCSRNVIAVAVLNLPATILIVN